MRRSHTFAIISSFFLFSSVSAQDTLRIKEPKPHEFYPTGAGEWIFSAPILDVNGNDRGSIVRFAPFFNLQGLVNYDLNKSVGFFTGLSLRNLGFIYDVPDSPYRHKYRAYTVGVPIGIKVGRMNRSLIFAGYELEIPFNYKEKTFQDGEKVEKFTAWFSGRTEPLFHSLLFGNYGPHGGTVKFKYYLTNFHNTDYTETVGNEEVKPYSGFNANIFYVSIGYGLFNGRAYTYKRSPKKGPQDREI